MANLLCSQPEKALLDPAPVCNSEKLTSSIIRLCKNSTQMELRKASTISKLSARRRGEVPELSQSEEGWAENGVHAFFVLSRLRGVLSSEVRGWMAGIGGGSAACKAEGCQGSIANQISNQRRGARRPCKATDILRTLCRQLQVQASPHQLLLSLVDPAPLAKQAYEGFSIASRIHDGGSHSRALTFCTVRAITISVAQLRPYQRPPRMQKAHLDLDGGGFQIFIPTGDC